MNKTLPRGIRNNNPLNIVHSKDVWQGRFTEQTDPKFVQFASMEYGIRAALILLRNYIKLHSCNNIRDIIRRWCPDETAASYAQYVSQKTGFAIMQPLDAENPQHLVPLAMAMAEVETGYAVCDTALYMKPVMFHRAWKMIKPDYEF